MYVSVKLSSWKAKIDSEASQICADGDAYIDGGSDDEQPRTEVSDNDTAPYRGGCYQDNILTVGFVGKSFWYLRCWCTVLHCAEK